MRFDNVQLKYVHFGIISLMVTVRIFRTHNEAERAKKVLAEAAIYSEISEDKFEGVHIQKYGVPSRFRLCIFEEDLNRTAKFLAKKIKISG